MENIHKVCIGGFLFTLDEEAYEAISSYISSLTTRCQGKANGNEIIEAIEGRIAELLIERGCRNGMVTAKTVNAVLATIGDLKDIFDDQDEKMDSSREFSSRPEKRLFRDACNKKIAGVCSGIGVYFGIDPSLIRIILAVLTVLAAVTGHNLWSPFLFIVPYCILWICMPIGRTSTANNYGGCEIAGKKGRGGDFVRAAGNILRTVVGIIVLLAGATALSFLTAALIQFTFYSEANPGALAHIISGAFDLIGGKGDILMFLVLSALYLPFIWLLYLGILLLFKLKAPKWKPGMIIIVLWLITIVVLFAEGCFSYHKYSHSHYERKKAELSELTGLAECPDTLHIKLENLEEWKNDKIILHGDKLSYHLYYFRTDSHKPLAVFYPQIVVTHIKEDKDDESAQVTLSVKHFPNLNDYENNSDDLFSFCRFSGDTIYVSPSIYGPGHEVRKPRKGITLILPESTTVIIDEPVSFSFDRTIRHGQFAKLCF